MEDRAFENEGKLIPPFRGWSHTHTHRRACNCTRAMRRERVPGGSTFDTCTRGGSNVLSRAWEVGGRLGRRRRTQMCCLSCCSKALSDLELPVEDTLVDHVPLEL